MNSSPCRCDRAALEALLRSPQVGAYSFGIASAGSVGQSAVDSYKRWLASGYNASMSYMERNNELRENPDGLLPGVKSLIVCAFAYPRPSAVKWDPGCLRIASYALGDDYHDVLRRRLNIACAQMKERFGGEYRVCIDTAPLRERYWAVQSGLGCIGLNGLLIIPGAGSCFFLGTILTTLELPADSPCTLNCGNCRRCVVYCPSHALVDDPSGKSTLVDARRCLSCLTIEHRGELPQGTRLGNRLYGCDMCQTACPHNRTEPAPEPLPEFMPRPALLELTKERIERMDHDEYAVLFKGSAIKRAKLDGLKRNARACD